MICGEIISPVPDENGINYEEFGYALICSYSEVHRSFPRGVDAVESMDKPDDSTTSLCTGELYFEIGSTRTIMNLNQKYTVYSVVVSFRGASKDVYPAVIKRRYTDFLNLYNSLKKAFPLALSMVEFPKKVVVGKFSYQTITERIKSFEIFMHVIGSKTELRYCQIVSDFLQRRELDDALNLIRREKFEEAFPLVENAFQVMNKFQTTRSPMVIRNLCLLICLYYKLENPRAMELACLAVRRFQGISDSDLLRYYVPLLTISLDLSEKYGRGTDLLQEHLNNLKKRGVACHHSTPLLTLLMEDFDSSI